MNVWTGEAELVVLGGSVRAEVVVHLWKALEGDSVSWGGVFILPDLELLGTLEDGQEVTIEVGSDRSDATLSGLTIDRDGPEPSLRGKVVALDESAPPF